MSSLKNLVAKIVNNEVSFEAILSDCRKLASKALLNLIGKRYIYTDLVDEVVSEIWVKLSDYNPDKGEFSTFVYWVVREIVQKDRRSQMKKCTFLSEMEDEDNSVDLPEKKNNQITFMYECMDELNQEDRDILKMYYLDNLTLEQIGIKMGYTKVTAGNKHKKAIQTMRSLMT